MVNGGHLDADLRSRHRYHDHYPGRFNSDGLDSRYADPYDRRQPILNIGDALRQYCGVSAKRYFVAVILEDGTPTAFSGPDGKALEPHVIKKFFDEEAYKRAMNHSDAGVTVENAGLNNGLVLGGGSHRQNHDYPRSRTRDHRHPSNMEDWETPERLGRKRPRARPLVSEEDAPLPLTITRRGIRIDNSKDLWDFYEQRFKNCQQTACKLIAKAWVKAIEPKKQSTHPYTGSDERAPDWWPKPWGAGKEDRVRHKEPDHLYKRERVYLLNHILKLVVEPKNERPDVPKLNLNVKKLEDITMEALSAFFTDKENPSNFRKKPYLIEIFRVAKQQERYKNDEIDATTEVFVMAEDKVLEMYASETDDSSSKKRDKNQNLSTSKLSTSHGLITSPEHSSAGPLHSSSILGGELPVRGTQFPPPMVPAMVHDQHAFVEGNSLSVTAPSSTHTSGNGSLSLDVGVSTTHGSGRRPSMFSSASTDYSAQGGTGLYAQQWQTGSAAPHSPAVYSFSQQQVNPSPTNYVDTAVSMGQNQSYLGSSFDGLPRAYEAPHSSMFRTGAVSQQPVHTSAGYDYVSHDNRELSDAKPGPGPRNSMH